MGRYHGRKGKVYMAVDGSSAAINVISLSKWNIDFSTDKVDVTAFGDTNKQYVQGLRDVKGALSGFWDDTDTTLLTASSSTLPVRLYLYPSTDIPAKYASGAAWVDMKVDTDVKDAIKVDGSWVAGGNWDLTRL